MASYDNYNTASYNPSSATSLPRSSRQEYIAKPAVYFGRNRLAGHMQDQFYHHRSPHGQMQMQVGRWYAFPPGTDPNVIRCFEMVDRDRSGYIDENELQQALSSSGYQRFKLRTVRLLMFLFGNPSSDFLRIGPREFMALWTCLGQWRTIFERFDRDRSGKIDLMELKDALYSLGYALPPSVLHVLISRYSDDKNNAKFELDFDSFVECGMIVKGLTERFKDKDKEYTGCATLTYDAFLSMAIPFIVPY